MIYYSQSKQDRFIDRIVFNGKTDGLFLEIGAYDGVTFSNTYIFEKERNWKGICVEPIPAIYNKLRKNRNCECIEGCISEEEGEVEITHVDGPSEMLTGITKNYNPEHSERIEKEIKNLGGKKNKFVVKSYNLTKILDERKIYHVDYCSIDVEGSEWEVLKSIDFDKITFSSFTIENNYKDKILVEFMLSKGYILVGKLDADDVYVPNNVKNIIELKILCKVYNLFNKLSRFKK